jgi:ParB family chromosome partitioning protein
MAKIDELLKSSGNTLLQSASVRPGPAGMPSVASASGGRDPRKDGLDRSKVAWTVPLDKIERDPNQPREEFSDEEIARLAESLKAHGLIQAITVIWSEQAGRYRIVSGERRYRAATLAGWPSIACNVLDKPLEPDELLALQCVENLMREDLKPIEQARAFRTLLTVNGWSITKLAAQMGISQSAVSQSLRMLELPSGVQVRVDSGHLAPVAAYHLAKIEDPGQQAEVAERIISEGLNRDQVVEVVREATARTAASRAKGRAAIKARPKRPTVRTFKATTARVTVEFKRAADLAEIAAALEEVLAKVRAEQGGDTAAA